MRKYLFNNIVISKIPEKHGVYTFYDKNKTPIYVGKANSLKVRLRSYLQYHPFGKNTNLRLHSKEHEFKIDINKTDKLVSNIRYLSYILVDSEIEALLLEAKLIKKYMPRYNILLKDGKKPVYVAITGDKYPIVVITRNPKDNSQHVYGPFLNSSYINTILDDIRLFIPYSNHLPFKRPCIYRQMGLCNPCPSEIEFFSEEKYKSVLIKQYFRNVRNIKSILNGKIKQLENTFRKSMYKYSVKEMYEEAEIYRNKLIALKNLVQPVANIELYDKDPYLLYKTANIRLADLRKLLSKHFSKINLGRIECYDISHIGGSSSAGSMVVFINGLPEKSQYRKFRLRKSFNNDVSSLKEIAIRRTRHFDEWGKPDLIIVDGGKGQTNAFVQVFESYGIPVIGLAKRFERIFIKQIKGNFSVISPKNGALLLLQRIRNESHRFAVSYHRKLVKKAFFQA